MEFYGCIPPPPVAALCILSVPAQNKRILARPPPALPCPLGTSGYPLQSSSIIIIDFDSASGPFCSSDYSLNSLTTKKFLSFIEYLWQVDGCVPSYRLYEH